ncbi:hypothetical protein RES5_011630 (plasmid) [Staphylococcus haemolyticus]|uniref:site-2 protease family protein n=1 Tax=Staphylococcus haemolyticus TaxID=1283 RepID=UPI0013753273|nr:site-2 protease family protein [Staphylococcus haemolyticus]QUX20061.1 hypothetical protein RES7_011510 [Staphylococcus haemolyticus]UCI01043.1 hypothetical protein RES5_011630 [Staphylococcus haemolyticus]UCI03252.1 hypothetical protein RES6_011625 [Staphylococcus haemolyticus]
MKKVNNNIFCLFVCIVAIVISEFFINVVGLSLFFSFISQIILFILLAVSIHEFGHYITGRLIGFKLIFLTSILGIQTQKKYYAQAHMNLATGYTAMYKPVHLGQCTKREIIIFYLGGGGINLLFILLFTYISYLMNFQVTTLNYIILANICILSVTYIPSDNNDMAKVIKILKGDKEDLNNFNIQSLQADPDSSSEEIINKTSYTDNELTNSIIDLAKIELYSRDEKNIKNIKNMHFDYNNNEIQWQLEFFKKIFEYSDTKIITTNMEKVFSNSIVDEYPILSDIVKYIYTHDNKSIEGIKKNIYQIGANNKVKIIKNFLKTIK